MDDSSEGTGKGWENWNEFSAEKRSGNYTVRRWNQTGRLGEAVAVAVEGNGGSKDEALVVMIPKLDSHSYHVSGNGNGLGNLAANSFKWRSRGSFAERGASVVATGRSGKTSCNVYRILILLVAGLFLVGAVTNGVVFVLFRYTDLQAESLEIFPRVFGSSAYQAAMWNDEVRFLPRNVVDRLLLSKGKPTIAELRKERRFPVRFPGLALICPNLVLSPLSLYVLTIATGLLELGYNLEVHTLKDGELRSTWEALGVPARQLKINNIENVTSVDWLNYEGVIAFSASTKAALNSLAQEPFVNIPVVWVITDDALGRRLEDYDAAAAKGLLSDWRLSFKRADVVVFQDYALPMIYTRLDTGNFFVIPGSTVEVWAAEKYMLSHSRESLRAQYRFRSDESVIAVVGSPFLYHGSWREHALVMLAFGKAVSQMGAVSPKGGRRFQLLIFGHGNQSSSYGAAMQVMAEHLGLEKGTVHYVGAGEDVTGMLWMSDAVLYSSSRDEQAFPPILSLAMSLQRPVIAPNRSAFREQIVDGENGVLFPVGDDMKLSDAIVHVLKDEAVGAMAVNGQSKARNMFASNVILSYGELLESILEFPSDAELPRPLGEVAKSLKGVWGWNILFPASAPSFREYFQSRIHGPTVEKDVDSGIIEILEHQWMLRSGEDRNFGDRVDSAKSIEDWDFLSEFDQNEAKADEKDLEAERTERGELDGRKEQLQLTWEDITKMIKKTEVHKDDLKERSDAEIQRSGQPLCIYELYDGNGAWPFLQDENTLYRGLSLSTRAARPGDDDVNAQKRLPGLLNYSYYRNVLCEYGAFFAIANRIDFVHKNPWIGFQPWRASSKNVALTTAAEAALSEAVRNEKHGDAVYFWARSDGHAGSLHRDPPVEQPDDFWSYCDSINSRQCRKAFIGSLRRMYGLPANWSDLPPMPADSGTWSALHSWAMPTSSFVELVMFARMFVDALDSQFYEEHHNHGSCIFVRFQREGQHCYCRLLEGLVNVWAYHSARRMVYVDPKTGRMEEQHSLGSRHGKMWVRFFSLKTLRSMDRDLAEAADDGDKPRERWLWPRTGEVYWRGIADRERQERLRLKLEKKQKLKERLARMRSKTRQKSLGRFIKPPPGVGYVNPS